MRQELSKTIQSQMWYFHKYQATALLFIKNTHQDTQQLVKRAHTTSSAVDYCHRDKSHKPQQHSWMDTAGNLLLCNPDVLLGLRSNKFPAVSLHATFNEWTQKSSTNFPTTKHLNISDCVSTHTEQRQLHKGVAMAAVCASAQRTWCNLLFLQLSGAACIQYAKSESRT